ncbi:NRDE protein-domain-containing protein [Pseudomassariella vexata]|uniref:NRDE protein-domain-containing protein n=1 Tax=Pseudomassariella vexata TaxID=1141098 RepID=A0A1Y2DQS9_9PEZI|nr:NRDE protein-domain-containing protein [Pseudomassariella vexata]ORY61631.1 NRDE protein-domain-containing protein [Pseudomassariella vexata]
MCIALIATSHPKYALIVLDNRDEYVLRPTSRPSWWTHAESGHSVLSAVDLHRREHGTWMGITKQGRLAVLTNYRETNCNDPEHPINGVKSRGGMVTAWLGAPDEQDLQDFVIKMLEGRMVKGVGGFSLICGDLKRKGKKEIEPLAIISNRSEGLDSVPWIGGERDKVWGLSNTVYTEPATWKKVKLGKQLLEEAIRKAVEKDLDEDELTEALYSVLDTDTLPLKPGMKFEEFLDALQESIFVPAMDDETKSQEWRTTAESKKMKVAFNAIEDESCETIQHAGLEAPVMFDTGPYGTQRQTIILVDWEGNVTYKERALWDADGNSIERGKGDMTFKFAVDE